MTTDWQSVVNDPQVDIVTELVGGTSIARTMILAALKLGKPVITANKALLSAHGEELFAAAQRTRHQPLLRSQRLRRHPHHQIAARRLRRQPHHPPLRHRQRHLQLHPHPDEARRRGFRRRCSRTRRSRATPRRRPILDIDGWDAQHKIGILASLAHGFWVNPKADSRRRHPPHQRARHPVRRATRLHDQAAGHHQEGRRARRRPKAAANRRNRRDPGLGLSDAGAERARAGQREPRLQRRVRARRRGGRHLFYGRGAGKDATA